MYVQVDRKLPGVIHDVPDSGNAKAAFTDQKASKAVCLYQLGVSCVTLSGSTSEWFIAMLMEVCVMRAIRTTSGGVCGDRWGYYYMRGVCRYIRWRWGTRTGVWGASASACWW
jgi:hypothetical protein